MVNYQQAKIYAIRSKSTNAIYIGSTTKKTLGERMAQHRFDYKRHIAGKYDYCRSFDILKLGDAYIELICEFPCDSKDQLSKKEGEMIRADPYCINHNLTGITTTNTRELCDCGKLILLSQKKKHLKSKKHSNDKPTGGV